ncbi:MAG: sterol carrier family protein [Candidatus Nanopelagicales bacterium]
MGTRAEVKAALAAFAEKAPGRSVEIRIPPYGAIQAISGGPHRRGTPRAVVECDGPTWLALTRGELTWEQALAEGRIDASGERSDLSQWLPLTRASTNES